MKFLDYLFHGKELRYIDSYFKMLNGYSPTFTSYNGGVYEMDLTRTAVNSFATHCSKLKPEIEGSALKSLEKTLQHKPNYFMDTTKFIKRLATYVAVEHTAFIIPIEDEYGRLCGWYPLRAQRCEVVEAAGQVYLRYLFANGEHGAIEFERVGIMTDFEYTGMILALVTRTAYKGGVSIPVSTVKPTATWVNEGAGSDKQKKNIAKDGMITFAYHKLRCAVAVSLEVDTMAISAFETLLINNIVEAMTKALEQAIIDGNGTGKPKGILAETPADGQTIESAAPSYSDLIKAEGALPMAYENGAVWCMSKKTFMEYVGMTDKNGQPIAKVNYGTSGKPERTLLGRTVVLCDYVASYSAALAKDTIFAFLFNFKDYVLNTNYSMGVKKYEDNDTDDQITKGIMLVDGKVVDKNSLVVVKKIEAV